MGASLRSRARQLFAYCVATIAMSFSYFGKFVLVPACTAAYGAATRHGHSSPHGANSRPCPCPLPLAPRLMKLGCDPHTAEGGLLRRCWPLQLLTLGAFAGSVTVVVVGYVRHGVTTVSAHVGAWAPFLLSGLIFMVPTQVGR